MLGTEGLLTHLESDGHMGGLIEENLRHSAVASIYGGTSEINRNMIAEAHLGLPRTRYPPSPSESLPKSGCPTYENCCVGALISEGRGCEPFGFMYNDLLDKTARLGEAQNSHAPVLRRQAAQSTGSKRAWKNRRVSGS